MRTLVLKSAQTTEGTEMIEMNTRDLRRLEENLRDLNAKGIHFAERNTINDMAFGTMHEARKTITEQFVNRNKWTMRSVQVDKARKLSDSAEVGSTEDYMADQEFGRIKHENMHIPTPSASGESPRASVRRRPVRRPNRMSAITLKRAKYSGMTRQQQNIATVKEAKAEGRKFVFLQRGKERGIYKVFGTKRKPKTTKIQDLSRRVAEVPRNPWLAPSSATVMRTAPQLYATRLQQQLDRLRMR
ncbi:hypothetical protein [Shewanella phage SFCi1]|nr:hypothetical protein [Shewanella phage SFCi1]